MEAGLNCRGWLYKKHKDKWIPQICALNLRQDDFGRCGHTCPMFSEDIKSETISILCMNTSPYRQMNDNITYPLTVDERHFADDIESGIYPETILPITAFLK